MSAVSESLSQLEVLVVDCQATAAAPRGHLLEIGWTHAGAATVRADARLIALPHGEHIPPAVVRLTGISERMSEDGVSAHVAWRELSSEAATLAHQPAPTVIHFARFEQPFLRALAGEALPLDILCTHGIARRLLPDLPRCGVRALAGYFGRGVGTLRRSADHVEATAFVWRKLAGMLEAEGISTWSALKEWLAVTAARQRRPFRQAQGRPFRQAQGRPFRQAQGRPFRQAQGRRRVWPMPREVRLSLPDVPGIYRMLRTSGDVLYVGKAASLRHRVNSYFRKQRGVHERTLEMLSQARGISFAVTPSALEAALIEPDEIKQHRPPYNVALTIEQRALWFARPDLTARSTHPSSECSLGPFPSAGLLDDFGALAAADRRALGSGRWRPDAEVFEAGYARIRAAHPELSRQDLGAHDRLLRLGTRLWKEGRRDRDLEEDDSNEIGRRPTVWTAESVHLSLEWLALRAALARRRAIWLTRLFDSSVVWREPDGECTRLIVIENGEVVLSRTVDADATPPIPPGYCRSAAARRAAFTLPSFDRMRVLTTELKRLTSAGAPVALRLGAGPPLSRSRLASALWWV